jgi:hypothetical protein
MKIAEPAGSTGVFGKEENQKIPSRRWIGVREECGVSQEESAPATACSGSVVKPLCYEIGL